MFNHRSLYCTETHTRMTLTQTLSNIIHHSDFIQMVWKEAVSRVWSITITMYHLSDFDHVSVSSMAWMPRVSIGMLTCLG